MRTLILTALNRNLYQGIPYFEGRNALFFIGLGVVFEKGKAFACYLPSKEAAKSWI
jgi:hypothetical protein